ncbi:DUF4920 domain-containing protein [Mucilaginibacter sp. RS28]|uniref:DUF4920 domain-containing protein n=1 Tax=Mucilaginibacter straminoryzae TaxID=2932774 RepID=A0A9X1X3S2_9SPHI|nr:DUF4920 domain-containing protein [Mucilaginibacter straminoryzae]MCJ8210594.1 DUF4920 domain-containing protein [Mucilaginibacter straminoryzae]
MKTLRIIAVAIVGLFFQPAYSQKFIPLPHGMTFGSKPSNVEQMPASRLEAFMGKRTRTQAVIVGKVLRVTKSKGGWFDIDAGKGKIISAHFANASINLPLNLRGREVIADGTAQKQFIADDMQHFAGDTVHGKKQHQVNANPKQKLIFEVKGLMVNK